MKSSLEHGEQVTFVRWFRATFPDVLIYAIPNGGKRAITEAKRLKEEGVVPGVPDLHIPAWLLWIEMKRVKGGKVSADQEAVAEYLHSVGHTVLIGRGWEDAARQVLAFIKSRPAV